MSTLVSPIGQNTYTSLDIRKKKQQDLIEVPRTAITPTPFNFLRLPYDFTTTAIALVKAENKKDLEGRMDASLRLAAAPVSFLHKVHTSLGFLTKLSAILGVNSHFFKLPGPPQLWLIPASILGTLLCGIEGIFEGVSLKRILDLKNHIPTTFEPKEYLRQWQYLNDEYFSLNQNEIQGIQRTIAKKFSSLGAEERVLKFHELAESQLSVKKDNLARRVRPWLANEIENNIRPILTHLRSSDPEKRTRARLEAEAIFKKMDIQCKKKLIVHVVALTSLIVMAIGFLLPFFACPALLPLLFLGFGGLLGFARYLIENGYQDQEGWKFSSLACLPACLRWIYEKCSPKKEGAPSIPSLR